MSLNLLLTERRGNESHREYAYRIIRSSIMGISLVPETILNEAEIAAILGSSRTPVHEALKQLAKEHLVEIIPSRESRVSRIDFQQIMDGIFVRSCVEPDLIDGLRGHLSSESTSQLMANVRQQRQAVADGALERYYTLDNEFHYMIFKFSNWLSTYALMGKMNNQFNRFRALLYRYSDYSESLEKSLQDHLQIFYAVSIAKPLPKPSDIFVREHVTRSLNLLPELCGRFPTYFSGYEPERLQRELEYVLGPQNSF